MIPKISVIMVTYNREKLVERALNSVINQTFKEFELLLVNNGSTDNTLSVCEKYRNEDDRIKLYNIEKNKGSAYARNYAINYVNTEYLLIVDDDDYCEPKMFEHLYNMIVENNADIAITGCVDEYEDNKIVNKYVYDEKYIWNKEEGVSEFLKRDKFHTAPGTKLFKTNLFENVRFIIGKRIDDIHIIYKLFVLANKVVSQGLPMYRFYKHSGNETSFLSGDILKGDILKDYLEMQDERVKYISKNLPSLKKQVEYAKYSYMISMIEKIENGYSKECEKYNEYMKEVVRDNLKDIEKMPWLTKREEGIIAKYVEGE
ncbi:glycosyltransferase family 2 protein [Clostridium butyricum]|uniref:glycosyltransferase family 2 protein n=1 Tax=Clostridium butyricum TaxID=1492 RepID=UPI0021081AAC|nr:glycosyltransferase family 2 protein [Clostridium butyricum]MCQ2014188.1 glycosyltransferase [Clostridium butyricum]MCQ2026278.1 glycosyltransferase [Clostridium butyricum]